MGLLPSIIWLAFYLHEDVKPEPKRLVLWVFVVGMISAFAAAILEVNVACFILPSECAQTSGQVMNALKEVTTPVFLFFNFFGIAFIEEIVKYLAVFFTVLRKRDFDEPIDAMIYMIIAALGFAAVENVSTVNYLAGHRAQFHDITAVLTLRFLGATFLHTLSSGMVGYALARAFFSKKSHFILLIPGVAIATLVHGLYNIFVGITAETELGSENFNYFFRSIILLLVVSAAGLFVLIQHLHRLSRNHNFVNLGDHAQES